VTAKSGLVGVGTPKTAGQSVAVWRVGARANLSAKYSFAAFARRVREIFTSSDLGFAGFALFAFSCRPFGGFRAPAYRKAGAYRQGQQGNWRQRHQIT
jgi:hypothetical protein